MSELRPPLLVDVPAARTGKSQADRRAGVMIIDFARQESLSLPRVELDDGIDEDDEDEDDDTDEEGELDEGEGDDEETETWQVSGTLDGR
jgi:hypothetical protein